VLAKLSELLKTKLKAPLKKADSTLRSSQAVPHPSTNRALRRLTSEVGRDPVHSTRYGRQRSTIVKKIHMKLINTGATIMQWWSFGHTSCKDLGLQPAIRLA
jgi:hypothetical protein